MVHYVLAYSQPTNGDNKHLVIKFSKFMEIFYMLEAVLGRKVKYVWPVPRISCLIGDGSGRLDL